MKTWTTKHDQKIYRILDGRCNCFLVSFNNSHILVDAGQKGGLKKLYKRFDQLGVTKDTLKAVVLTHCHFDHAENVADVKQTFNIPVICQRDDADHLKAGTSPLIRGTFLPTRILSALLTMSPLVRLTKYPPAEPDILVDDTYDLTEMGINGRLIHTPGHTPGSMSVILDNEVALVGDTMFGAFSGKILPPFAVDEKELVNSWKKLLDTGCFTFLPSHGTERYEHDVQHALDRT